MSDFKEVPIFIRVWLVTGKQNEQEEEQENNEWSRFGQSNEHRRLFTIHIFRIFPNTAIYIRNTQYRWYMQRVRTL